MSLASAAVETVADAPHEADFVANDGVRLRWYRWGEPGDQVPVVLHHGFAANSNSNWQATGIVDRLRRAGRSVISLDARGHGRSDAPHDAERYGETRMARDLIALLDHLGIPSFDLFGYSMGAVVGLLVASQDRRVRRLIVGGIGDGVLHSGGVDLRVMDRAAVVDALLSADPASIAKPGLALFRAFAEHTGSDLRALAAQAMRMHDAPIALDAIASPALVLAGQDDVLAANIEALAAALPEASSARVPGGHLDAVRDPRFAELAIGFLGQTSPTPSNP